MRLDIRIRNGEPSGELRDSIDRHVRFALGRFGGRIQRTEVVMTDVNGPRGGSDQRCILKVVLPFAEPAVIDVTDSDALTAVARACERAARRVRDQVSRRRELGRRVGFVPRDATG
jgi:hypothetical protein